MAREVIMQTWCDPCLANDVHEPAVPPDPPITFTLGTRQWELDTCEVHYKELLQPLVEALHEYGIKGDRVPSSNRADQADEPHQCKVCGTTLKNRSSFNAHLRQMHGMRVAVYRAQYEGGAPAPAPDPAPSKKAQAARKPSGVSEATCEVCGKVYSHELGNNRPAQALGVHKAQAHGIRAERIAKAAKAPDAA